MLLKVSGKEIGGFGTIFNHSTEEILNTETHNFSVVRYGDEVKVRVSKHNQEPALSLGIRVTAESFKIEIVEDGYIDQYGYEHRSGYEKR